ncbi:MAG: hypothetical protein CVV49_00605 [Spirochaetae bacterium HGW-Spirochaetae-5]|nr:MAG: hypothetical protein CVV49_00605 [Spirochaetae bacterium HGW-Spirochaetae-5]
MSHTRIFDPTLPLDTELAGDGDDKIRELLVDIKERFELDHNMDGILDTSLPTADGYHKKVTLPILENDPALLTNSGVLYQKSDGLYFKNSAGVVRII